MAVDVGGKPRTSASSSPMAIMTCQSSAQPSDHLEHLPEKELLSLQNVGADSPSVGRTATAKKLNQEHEVHETVVKSSSSISHLSASEGTAVSEAISQGVVKDNVRGLSEICEPKSTSMRHRAAVVKSRESNINCGSTKQANKQAKSRAEVYRTDGSNLMSSAGQPQRDRLRGHVQDQLDSAHSKTDGSVAAAAAARRPTPAATKRFRATNEGRGMMLRSLDSQETRVVSGLLTSLVRDRGGRLSSGSCYQLVRTGTSSSALVSKPPRTSSNRPLAVVSLKCLAKVLIVYELVVNQW